MLARLDKPLRPRVPSRLQMRIGRVTVASALETEPWNRRVHQVDGQAPGLADPGRRHDLGRQRRSCARTSTFPPTPGLSCNGCCSASSSCFARPGRCSTTNTSGSTSSTICCRRLPRHHRRRRPRLFSDAALHRHDLTGGPFFMQSFEVNEQSGNAGRPSAMARQIAGHHRVRVLAGSGHLRTVKRIAVMRGLIPDPHASQVHALEAEVEHLVEAIEKR